ncbi:DoxX family protein [Micromonospora sp. KC207]|uniref:DoxX family protein n=1 Tax=Micromonospora sp. KC207 TaxID=2530377 RepID=UPI0010432830|nr:DoxX family protein [Micromonospora sp. KC207]TDC61263.1 DoxX family protein [Micromonospora sp. KC207]
MRIPIIALSVILAAVFMVVGVQKLVGERRIRERLDHLGVSAGLTRIVGALELAAVVGLFVGLLWSPAGVAAAVGLVPLMVGAAVYHVRARDSFAVTAMPVAFGVAAAALAMLHVLQG